MFVPTGPETVQSWKVNYKKDRMSVKKHNRTKQVLKHRPSGRDSSHEFKFNTIEVQMCMKLDTYFVYNIPLVVFQ